MRRREIVMIFSDFFGDLEELESAMHRMRYNKHEVVLFQIMHHDELAFEFDGMVKFVGLEIPDELLAQTDDLRRGYLQALASFNEQLEQVVARNGCERIVVDTSRDMGELFVDYMNQRSLLNRGR
jgi:hypothetical protein